MKKTILSISIILASINLTSCANNGGSGGLFAPEVVSGNENYVTVSDFVGAPGAALQTATSYCSKYNKTPTLQGKGGDSFKCSGNTFCTTYQCVSK